MNYRMVWKHLFLFCAGDRAQGGYTFILVSWLNAEGHKNGEGPWRKAVRGAAEATCLFSLEKRRLSWDLVVVFNIFTRGSNVASTDLFSVVTSNRTSRDSLSSGQERFGLNIRKRFYTQWGVGPWKRLPREVVKAPSLLKFKKCLDNAPRDRVWLLYCPVQGQELDPMILTDTFQVSILYDSIFYKIR